MPGPVEERRILVGRRPAHPFSPLVDHHPGRPRYLPGRDDRIRACAIVRHRAVVENPRTKESGIAINPSDGTTELYYAEAVIGATEPNRQPTAQGDSR